MFVFVRVQGDQRRLGSKERLEIVFARSPSKSTCRAQLMGSLVIGLEIGLERRSGMLQRRSLGQEQ
jgi:hypothetical protein